MPVHALLWFLLLWVLSCSTPLSSAVAAEGPEQILAFHSEIAVHRDASLTVTETILINARGQSIRHGIYRDFPTLYQGRFGSRHTTGFQLLAVERDGRGEPWHQQRLENGVRTYIGDPSLLIAEGLHRYRIQYRSDRQLAFGNDHDQLYWNVTGNQWAFPILRANATIRLPEGAADRLLSAEGWTGPQGSTAANYRRIASLADEIRFETTTPLAAGEGFTLRLSWPTGLVARPPWWKTTAWFLHDNALLMLSALFLALLPVYFLFSWLRVGRDPERGVVVPTFMPPRDLSPAAMRFITRNRYDSKTFSAAVINTAVKGYLKIIEHGRKRFRLQRVDTNTNGQLSAGEQQITSTLLGGRSSIEIGGKYDPTVKRASDSLRSYLRREFRDACYRDNAIYGYVGLATGLLALLLFALHSGPGDRDWLLPLLFLTGFAAWGVMRGKLLFTIAPVAMMFVVFLSGLGEAGRSPAMLVVALLVLALFALFNYLLRAPTPYGRKVLDEIEGFRLYLATAEQDRLNLLHPPEKSPELFERYLPYALALDVENQWSAQFSGILDRAGREEPHYRPSWYEGGRFSNFGHSSFAAAVGSGLAGSVAAAASPPSSGGSGGFGGGGSSGGGGGGGGGGGW